MKTKWMLVFFGATLSGCVSTGVVFQDGKTAGKNGSSAAIGISYNLTPGFTSDTVLQEVELDPFQVPAPWISLQGQYGVTERLDVGGGGGIGLLAAGLGAFTKLALLPNDQRFNVSVYGAVAISFSNDKVENANLSFKQVQAGLPFSLEVSKTNTLVLQPMYSHDYYKVKVSDETVNEDRFDAHLLHCGFGYIRKNIDNEREIFYNLTINYSAAQQKVYPTFGVAIRP